MAMSTTDQWPREVAELHVRAWNWQYLGRLPTQDELNLSLLVWYGGYGVPGGPRGSIAAQDAIAGSPEAFGRRKALHDQIDNAVGEPSGIWADVQAIKAKLGA